jgi:hypothetical protein
MIVFGVMPQFAIGDRVEIIGEAVNALQSKVGVILAASEILSGRAFKVRLADGSESDFSSSQLQVQPAIVADMIFDTQISPPSAGVRGASWGRHLRFVSREIDIHIKVIGLDGLEENNDLLGQLSADQPTLDTSLITLLRKGEPYATTATNSLGEFELRQIPSGSTTLEILIPSRRILASFDISA